MIEPLEIQVGNRRIKQVVRDPTSKEYWESGTTFVVTADFVAFPVVDIRKKFGPYAMEQLALLNGDLTIGEVMQKDISGRLTPEQEDVNGFLVVSSERVKGHVFDRERFVTEAAREKVTYFLVNYTITDRFIVRQIAGDEKL